MIQYQAATAAEIYSWNGLLNGTTTTAEMQTAIIYDPYTLNVVDPVIREYQAAFGRIPDEAGITYWVGQVAANPAELCTLSVIFANSTEFFKDYGATATTPANTALVTSLYLNVLGRAPDAPGLAYWVNSGLDAAQLLQTFAQSAEFIADAATPIVAVQTEISNNPTAPYPTGSLFSLPPSTFSALIWLGHTPVSAQVGLTLRSQIAQLSLIKQHSKTYRIDARNSLQPLEP